MEYSRIKYKKSAIDFRNFAFYVFVRFELTRLSAAKNVEQTEFSVQKFCKTADRQPERTFQRNLIFYDRL